MEAKHTPGPWIVDKEYPNQVLIKGTPKNYSLTGQIADCSRGYWKDEVSLANAHLIAAAPDLLEACKYTRDLLGSGIGQSTHALAMIEAAIQLAEKGE